MIVLWNMQEVKKVSQTNLIQSVHMELLVVDDLYRRL